MNDSDTLINWAHALAAGDYAKAISLLECHQSHRAPSKTPLASPTNFLLRLTRAWSQVDWENYEKEKEPNANPTARRCSFCSLPEDENRRIIAGSNVFICDKCARNVADAFLIMEQRVSTFGKY